MAMERRKPYRYPAARAPVGETLQEGPRVWFTAPNGESYEVNVLKMQQRNLRTGKIRQVSCHSGGWFFDKHCTKPVPRWLPFSKPIHRALDAARDVSGAEPLEVHEAHDVTDDLVAEVSIAAAGPGWMTQVLESELLPATPSAPSFVQVRQAALSGSTSQVRWLLCSQQVQVLGHEIFDRRYPGFVLKDEHKCCIKMLLARGAKLGRFAPSSKLLRKVESDCMGLWLQCFLRSAALAGMDLPDPVQSYLLEF
ncbi:unnamed protein product [Durusdinium trenchii]|uniref:WWE domain-containing protein n=1 Tax=Durusdinium trenchii TaxID=1381693 RepID=A0ABP0RFD8_9DINO